MGANVLSGPDLRIADPEAEARTAYAVAFRAAQGLAIVYAAAADLEVARVLAIRDGQSAPAGGYDLLSAEARATASSQVAAPPAMAGTNMIRAVESVDFALAPR